MHSRLLTAVLLTTGMFCCTNSVLAQRRYIDRQRPAQANGLPACIHGPAVGQPGDNVSRGQFNTKANTYQPARSSVGLPSVRTSPCMGQPGDNIRSDMGHNIYGQAQQKFQTRQVQVQRSSSQAPVQTNAYTYKDYTH